MNYKYKYYPAKKEGEIRKTPFRSDSALQIAEEISRHYGYKFLKDFEKIKEYNYQFFVQNKEQNLEDLKNLVLDEWANLANKYNTTYKKILDKKTKELDEQLNKLTDKQRELFQLLHGNLSCEQERQGRWGAYYVTIYPMLFGISLEPIIVKTYEMKSLFSQYEIYKKYENYLFPQK